MNCIGVNLKFKMAAATKPSTLITNSISMFFYPEMICIDIKMMLLWLPQTKLLLTKTILNGGHFEIQDDSLNQTIQS